MKYIKLGLLISITNINAHCCWPEKKDYKKGVEDELVECFGVSKESILPTILAFKATPNKDLKEEETERLPSVGRKMKNFYYDDFLKKKNEMSITDPIETVPFQILGKIICNKDVMIIAGLAPNTTIVINRDFERYTGDYKEDVKKKKNIILYFRLTIDDENKLTAPNTLNNIELYKKR